MKVHHHISKLLDNKKFMVILGLLTSVFIVMLILIIRNAIRNKRGQKVSAIIEAAKKYPDVQVDNQGYIDIKSLQKEYGGGAGGSGGSAGGASAMSDSSAQALASHLVDDIKDCMCNCSDALWVQFNALNDTDFRNVYGNANAYMRNNRIVSSCGSSVDTFYDLINSKENTSTVSAILTFGVSKLACGNFSKYKQPVLNRINKLGLK